jgi:hypothetical protein
MGGRGWAATCCQRDNTNHTATTTTTMGVILSSFTSYSGKFASGNGMI